MPPLVWCRIQRRRLGIWWHELPEFWRALIVALPIALFAWLWIVLLVVAGL